MTMWSKTLPEKLSNQQKAWLSDTSSMSNRVRSLAKEGFKLQIIKQGWRNAVPAESSWLQLNKTDELLFVRTVTLGNQDTPWLVGHSLFPKPLLNRHVGSFTNLEETPLGDLLFNKLMAQRGPLDYCLLTSEDELYQITKPFLQQETPTLLARRSQFMIGEDRLAVHEAFLPELWQQLNTTCTLA